MTQPVTLKARAAMLNYNPTQLQRPFPKSSTGEKTLAAVLGSTAAAIALFTLIPAEESGRKVEATIAVDGKVSVRHVSGKQYLKAYLDSVNVPTACDGIATRDIKLGQTFTESQCTALLERELVVHAAQVVKCVPGVYGRPAQGISGTLLAYNVGGSTFCKSSIARLWNTKKWAAGCDRILLYNKAGGRVLRGLVNRRVRERAICMKDVT